MCDPPLQAKTKTVIPTETCPGQQMNAPPTGHSVLTPVKRMAQIEEFLEKQYKPCLKIPNRRQQASVLLGKPHERWPSPERRRCLLELPPGSLFLFKSFLCEASLVQIRLDQQVCHLLSTYTNPSRDHHRHRRTLTILTYLRFELKKLVVDNTELKSFTTYHIIF